MAIIGYLTTKTHGNDSSSLMRRIPKTLKNPGVRNSFNFILAESDTKIQFTLYNELAQYVIPQSAHHHLRCGEVTIQYRNTDRCQLAIKIHVSRLAYIGNSMPLQQLSCSLLKTTTARAWTFKCIHLTQSNTPLSSYPS